MPDTGSETQEGVKKGHSSEKEIQPGQPQKNAEPGKEGGGSQKAGWGGAQVTFTLIILVMGGIVYALFANLPVIRNLGDPAFARGIITFIITIATIGLAFVLVFQSFTGDQSGEDAFRRAREVFAGLMGVLGTIVGFYFGSTDKPVAPLEVATVKVAESQLITHISGGSRPYRYTISSTDADFKTITGNSEEGWIVESLEKSPKLGSQIAVNVTDNKDETESRKIDFPGKVAAQK